MSAGPLAKFLFRSAIRAGQWLAATPILRRFDGRSKVAFFPGCSLAAYSPAHVTAVRDFLRGRYGECGTLMACCAKPLKLMKAAAFLRRLDGVRRALDSMGAETVVTACQNCFKILKEHDSERQVLSLWPIMLEALPEDRLGRFAGLEVSVQDSCAMGAFPEVAASVRDILRRLGATVREMERCGPEARCCGGVPMIVSGDVAYGREWMRARAAESPCPTVVSYCASCRSAMGVDGRHTSLHLLDLIFGDGKPQRGGGLFNRWRVARLLYPPPPPAPSPPRGEGELLRNPIAQQYKERCV